MQTKIFSATAPKFSQLGQLAITMQTGSAADIVLAVHAFKASPDFASIGWQTAFDSLLNVLDTANPAWQIFKLDGNSKLPFIAFSVLPGVTCPGAGVCLTYCYSYKAWRYPAAFARQCQNTFLLRFAPDVIASALAAIKSTAGKKLEFRLYVDGDFSSESDVAFWMHTLKANPHINAYGYSKSFAELLAYGRANAWPTNYVLNISSGHNASPATVAAVKLLPITRGEFIALPVGSKPIHGSIDTNKALRIAAGDIKIFPCPGKCGTCTGSGHACGMPKLKGVVIAIAIHR